MIIILIFVRYTTGNKKELYAFLEKNRDRSFTIDELEALGIAKSSLYRILTSFLSDGLVRKEIAPGDKASYQYMGRECPEHMHIRCRECGAIGHIDKKTSKKILEIAERESGFLAFPTTMLEGLCSDCREKQ